MAVVPKDSLVSYWKLDEASGTRDDAHGSNDLTDNNTVLAAAGVINDGADFELATAEYLSITDAAQSGLDITGSMSISMWVKFESAPGSGESRHIINKWSDTTGQRGYRFFWFNEGGTNKYRFQHSSTGSDSALFDYNVTPSTATLYHLVMVYNSAASLGSRGALYINGSAITPTSDALLDSTFNGTLDFYMGANDGLGAAHHMDGIVDEVGIWSRVLTSGEVTALYNAGAGVAFAYDFEDSVTVSDTGTYLRAVFATLTDTLTLTDLFTGLVDKWRNLAKSVTTWINQDKNE